MNDYGIPKAWSGRTVWNSKGKGGLSILEFPKARGGPDEDAARGRVWIFSGITQYPYLHHRGSMEIPRRSGGLKRPKFLEESMSPNWNFQRGGRGVTPHAVCISHFTFLSVQLFHFPVVMLSFNL